MIFMILKRFHDTIDLARYLKRVILNVIRETEEVIATW